MRYDVVECVCGMKPTIHELWKKCIIKLAVDNIALSWNKSLKNMNSLRENLLPTFVHDLTKLLKLIKKNDVKAAVVARFEVADKEGVQDADKGVQVADKEGVQDADKGVQVADKEGVQDADKAFKMLTKKAFKMLTKKVFKMLKKKAFKMLTKKVFKMLIKKAFKMPIKKVSRC
jgi:vacuolar-type H+-ATPase subunit H